MADIEAPSPIKSDSHTSIRLLKLFRYKAEIHRSEKLLPTVFAILSDKIGLFAKAD